jgi:hypothetical protein
MLGHVGRQALHALPEWQQLRPEHRVKRDPTVTVPADTVPVAGNPVAVVARAEQAGPEGFPWLYRGLGDAGEGDADRMVRPLREMVVGCADILPHKGVGLISPIS